MKINQMDKTMLVLTAILVIGGFLIFSSAALGQLARSGASFQSVATSQFLFGIIGGGIAMFIMSSLHYRYLRQFAIYIFIFGLALTLAVFIPGLGWSHGGATRWIAIGGFTFQPSEFLKIAYIIYVATWLSGSKTDLQDFKRGIGPFLLILGVTAAVMLAQPDTDTFLIMAGSGVAMLLTAGAKWRDVGIIILTGFIALVILAFARPYVMDRVTGWLNPDANQLGANYQIQQSLNAVGSGGITGRGFGQSIQKFEYLPEPIGDSIFAVYGEEFGFIGTMLLVMVFAAFTFRGYKIAAWTKDRFGMLLVTGFVTLIFLQAFLNIGSMIRVVPLFGLTLPFISHGGTALMANLVMVGIILNVFKHSISGKKS